jgi:hypothetical protein
MNQTEHNFWLDVSLFVAFVSTALTGIILWLVIPHQAAAAYRGLDRHLWLTVHVGSGLASLAGSILHVIWHRLWLKALRGRRIASLPAKLRANRVMDRFVWITFLAANGFAALDWMIPAGENGVSISGRLHVAFGVAWLIGITVHLALHNKWITSATKRYFRVKTRGMVIIQPGGARD